MSYLASERSQKSFIWTLICALVFGLAGTLIGYGASTMFPGGETWLEDWQVAQNVSGTVSASIVLVTLEDHGPASCGNDRWNSAILAQTISALSQAGATVIAPALHFQVPNPPECGDVVGNAKLIEATKQAGNVVYPSSVHEGLARESRGVGYVNLETDEDLVFRRIMLDSLEFPANHLAFGLAIASVYSEMPSELFTKETRVPFVGTWTTQPFLTYPFSTIWDLIHQRDHQGLSEFVQDKKVILFPIGPQATTLMTPLEKAAPLGFVHANLLQAALSQSWFKPLPFMEGWLMTFFMAVVMAWLSLRALTVRGWVMVGVLMIGYVGVTQMMVHTQGQLWPLLAPILSCLVASVGAGMWMVYQRHNRASQHIKDASAQFTMLRERLVGKELVVEQLEEDLVQARDLALESTQKYEQVTASVESNQARLDAAQKEVDDTRQQLQELQQQLEHLHKATPSRPRISEPIPDSHLERLREECESLGILTCDSQVLRVFEDLKKAAKANSPILVLGETGTGKELFAQAAHRLSHRAQGPFVSVNMAALRPELFESELFGHVKGAFTGAIGRRGLIETADGGTLFLDEIGELPLDLQAKLLRVLEDGTFYRVGQSSPTQVDVRVVAATNRDLAEEVKAGRYREDFYYRLRSIVLRLPSLREREPEDLALLTYHFVQALSTHRQDSLQLTQGALKRIQSYPWPGNIRELRQTIAQAVALIEGSTLSEEDLRLPAFESNETTPAFQVSEGSVENAKEAMAQREDAMVLSFLRQYGFDMQATAKALQWDRSTVTQRLKGMGFQALVEHKGNMKSAAAALAGSSSLVKIVELKLRGYYKNLLSSTKRFDSPEHAIADCRKRFRNLPDRHFPAVETLIRQQFADQDEMGVVVPLKR